ncbi:Condensin-2 complex subunit D3 [Parelaphostrongylus tenuis]|uniref:Condensin-2 complex subunit D3 n=1 Tax=Parelaphostrongylus tenuis TaxID=148309 RepID=A0AAD5QQ03_PARTN|nr:Condensin-2 complex subunit D3 [Parelaphostrongylus tenuis]
MDAIGEESTGKRNLEKFGRKLLSTCRDHIRQSLLKIKDEYEDSEKLNTREALLIPVVLTIGEIIQYFPKLMSSAFHLFEALKTIISSVIFDKDEHSVINSAIPSVQALPCGSREQSLSRPPSTMSDQDGLDSQPASSQNAQVIPNDVLKAFKADRRALFTERIRAHAVLTVGKFCLMNEKIAKSTIPVFVKQLRLNGDHIIRNNIALLICDLCMRHTSMVDRYSAIVAAYVKDGSTLVRYQILESLTSLIKEQFIRWEGQIMYRFVSTILDENKVTCEYAKFCLQSASKL